MKQNKRNEGNNQFTWCGFLFLNHQSLVVNLEVTSLCRFDAALSDLGGFEFDETVASLQESGVDVLDSSLL